MTTNLAQILAASAYTSARLDPQPGHFEYLHLRDLRDALGPFADERPLRILDFGCGGSPYRALFPNAEYLRADFTPVEGRDYSVTADSQVIGAEDSAFDLVLSTQVLEHVRKPATYLSECWRVLKPGGQLILTTHGTYPDHGCPYDFWRWTSEGLKELVMAGGFTVERTQQLTCGTRALLYLWDIYAQAAFDAKTYGLVSRAIRSIYRLGCRKLAHRISDRWFAESGVRSADAARDGALYICLLISARRAA